MNASWVGFNALAGWVDLPIGLVLAAKWTVILGLAWLAHGLLAGQNPRWRVALWRGAMIDVVLIAVLSLAPPIVKYPLGPRGPAVVDLDRGIPTMPVRPDRRSPEPIAARSADGASDARIGIEPCGGDRGCHEPGRVLATRGAGSAGSGRGPGFSRGRACGRVVGLDLAVGRPGPDGPADPGNPAPVPLSSSGRRASRSGSIGSVGPSPTAWALAGAVPVRRSEQVVTPCLTGLRRPILLLPDRQCRDVDRDDLRAILATSCRMPGIAI